MSPSTIYLVVGSPCTGKTWVCKQLTKQFAYVPHDRYLAKDNLRYLNAIRATSRHSLRPVLAEAPFSVSQLVDPLTDHGFTVVPVFIVEPAEVLQARYQAREGKPLPAGHLTRQNTYRDRAASLQAFIGTSDEVLEHLRHVSDITADSVPLA